MRPKPFGLAIPKYTSLNIEGPYFGDLVWDHLKKMNGNRFDRIPLRVQGFPDGSEKVVVEENVREKVIYVVHTPYTIPARHVMIGAEMADAIRRSDSKEIYFVELYNPYSRQDARADREPITVRLVAELYESAGMTGIFVAEPHSKQMAGFFQKMEPLPMYRRLAERIEQKHDTANMVVVAPDEGGFTRAEIMAGKLGKPMAAIQKERHDGKVEAKRVIGDIRGKDCIIVDDIIGTGTTLVKDAQALKAHGAERVYGVATHLGLYGDAKRLLRENDIHVIGTNSLPAQLDEDDKKFVEVVDISDIIARVIMTKSQGGSLRKYFQ